MSRKIELFTTIDPEWLDYAWMFVASVRRATDRPIRYTILLSAPAQAGAFLTWARMNCIDLCLVDFAVAKEMDSSGKLERLPVPPHSISSCVYWGRYCAEFIYNDLPARLIYTDVDMLAVSDLSPLMTIELGGAAVGAVPLPMDHIAERVGIPKGRYVNNGLLVFDTSKFDGWDCICKMNRALSERVTVYGPQCAFNIAMGVDMAILNGFWNVQGETRILHELDAKLIHFTGDLKPWHTLSVDPLRQRVKQILSEIGCSEAWQPDWSIHKQLRRLATQTMRFLRVR